MAIAFLIGVSVVGLVRLVVGLAVVQLDRLRARPICDANLREKADILLAELRGPPTVVVCESDLLATPATIGSVLAVHHPAGGMALLVRSRMPGRVGTKLHTLPGTILPRGCAASCARVPSLSPLVHWLARDCGWNRNWPPMPRRPK